MSEKTKKHNDSYIMEFANEPVGIRQETATTQSVTDSGAQKITPGRTRYGNNRRGDNRHARDIDRPPFAGLYINLQRLVKCIAFALVFLLLLNSISAVLVRKSLKEPWNMTVKVGGFFNEPEESIDVMFFGSSHMYCSVDPVQLEELTGLSAYTLATQEQPVWVSYYYIKEALKTQRPQTVFFEVNMLVEEDEFVGEGTLYSAFDPMPLSLNKVSMVNAAVPWGERRHYMFNIMKYHDRWTELDLEEDIIREFALEQDPYRGYVCLTMPAVELVEERADVSWVTEVGTPLAKSVEYLEKIIALSREEGFQLILLKTPSNATVEEQKLYNAAWQIAQNEGIPYLDGNQLYEELALDLATDFYDQRHLNYLGAEKFTLYMAQYLK